MEQPRTFLVPKSSTRSMLLQRDKVQHFYDLLHCHEEVQLSLILAGRGMYTIAGQPGRFAEGDVYLLGSNVPHVFRNDSHRQEDPAGRPAEMFSVFFGKEGLGKSLELPEFQSIRDMLLIAQRGLKLKKENCAEVQTLLLSLETLQPAAQVILFLQIMESFARTACWDMIAPQASVALPRHADYARLNAVFKFLMENFNRPIQLEEAAAIAHLSSAAFCRFFKQRTRKTFVEYLNELRISHACRLLMETDLPVGELCYACGFNNLANFNRQFLRLTEVTPLRWRKQHGIVTKNSSSL